MYDNHELQMPIQMQMPIKNETQQHLKK